MQDLRQEGRMTDSEHTKRMHAARQRAQWELGDARWAGIIMGAYMNPEDDLAALEREKDVELTDEGRKAVEAL